MGENYMRLIILGIDALDIKMVEKLDLKALKQSQYGELKVPLSPVSGYPLSPSVWATFLTGQEKEIEFTRNSEGVNMFTGLDGEVFTDWDDVRGLNVPYRDHEIDTLTKLVRLRNRLSWPGTIRKIVRIHTSRTEQIFSDLIDGHDHHKVIFAYIQTLDTLQHMLYLRPKIIQNAYKNIEIMFSEAKNVLSEDQIIIVSDHGFDNGHHSYTGFYSYNNTLSPIPTNITDFYGIVKDFLKDGKTT